MTVADGSAFTRIRVVPTIGEHVDYLAPRLRKSDMKEARAMAASEPYQALRRSVVLSHEAWTGLVDEEPVAIWGLGIGSLCAGLGRPWLVGSEGIEQNAIAFLRRNKACIHRWASRCPKLENWVMAEHEVSVRWLTWLGFSFDEPAPFGPYGVTFRRFWMER